MSWDVNRLTGRYLDELARDAEAALRISDLVRVSPLPFIFNGPLLTRPGFLEAADVRQLGADVLGLYRILVTLPDRLFGGDVDRYGRAVGFQPAQVRLGLRTAGEWPPAPLMRGDLYHDGTGFKLLELNLSSALGGFQLGLVNRLMLQSELIRGFVEREGLCYADPMRKLAALLHRRYARGTVIALADWPAAYPVWGPLLEAMTVQLHELDIEARACHVGQLRAGSRGLTLDGEHVDVVFRYFNLSQVTADAESLALFEPLVSAYERGLVDLFMPLTSPLLATKRALVLLSDERHRAAFSTDELALVDRLLPWTRELRDGQVHFEGNAVDLRELCHRSREHLVVKPGYESGGHGTVCGWTVDGGEWAAALDRAWDGPFVVQRRVVPTPQPFPNLDTGEVEPWLALWGAYVIDGEFGGGLLRCSRNLDTGVVSMEAGAWMGSSFYPAGELAGSGDDQLQTLGQP